MNSPDDPITDADLCAYVDGELDGRRKMEVERYLSRDPAAAAAVMADLHGREVLRLAAGGERPPRSDVLEAARMLDRKLSRNRVRQLLPPASMFALAVLCAVLAQDRISGFFGAPAAAAVPAFVSEAIDTHKAARMRETMSSEIKDTVLDRAEIRKAARIVFPAPAHGWRILDSRVVPSDEGPGLEISLDAGSGAPVTFFAVPTTEKAPATPESVEVDGSPVAFWRAGDMGYALTGDVGLREIDRLATDFADNPIG